MVTIRERADAASACDCDLVLSFGYPADPSVLSAPPRVGGRRSLHDIVHLERW